MPWALTKEEEEQTSVENDITRRRRRLSSDVTPAPSAPGDFKNLYIKLNAQMETKN
jgi:hypothetical protein